MIDSFLDHKLKWIAFCFLIFMLTRFIPYSMNGPAMSCFSVFNETKNKEETYNYAAKHDYDLKKTLEFAENSGFSFRNLSFEEQTVIFVYTHRHEFQCAPINWLTFYASIMRIEVVRGDDGVDQLDGGSGNDLLIIDSNDTMFVGGKGKDTLVFNDESDFNYDLDEGGFENADLGSGNDTVFGDHTKNIIKGFNGDDKLYGEDGNDSLLGGNGDDILFGGNGDDRLLGENGDDQLFGGDQNDQLKGQNGNDTIYGERGDDRLVGGDGIDTLFGGEGKDFLVGGRGNDFLTGGSQSDIFHFDRGGSFDVIEDFQDNIDTLQLDNFAKFSNAQDAMKFAIQDGDGVFMNFGKGGKFVY